MYRMPIYTDPETAKAQAQAIEDAFKWVGRKLRSIFSPSAAGRDTPAPDAEAASTASTEKGIVPEPTGEQPKPPSA